MKKKKRCSIKKTPSLHPAHVPGSYGKKILNVFDLCETSTLFETGDKIWGVFGQDRKNC